MGRSDVTLGFRRSLLLCLVLGVSLGCGPRYARVQLRDQQGIVVKLRSELRDGESVEREFDHPVVISGIRIAHILATLDVRMIGGETSERRPAVHTKLLFELGDAVAAALIRANSTQEVVVQVVRKQRSFRVLSQDYLTSFVAYVRDDLLYLHFGYVDWKVPKGPEPKFPEPWAREPEVVRFKVIAGNSITPVSGQGVAVDWRDEGFRRAATLRFTGTGLKRRTILLDGREADLVERPAEAVLPVDLTPEALRELADLEEARRDGAVTEGEYKRRRSKILRGE